MTSNSNWVLLIDPVKLRQTQLALVKQGIFVSEISECKSKITINTKIDNVQTFLSIDGVLEASFIKRGKQ